MVSLVNSAKRVRKKHTRRTHKASPRGCRMGGSSHLGPRVPRQVRAGRPCARPRAPRASAEQPGCTRSCGHVRGTVRGPGGRRRPRTHLLHQQADVVALDGAAVQGGAGAHALHHCNRPGRGEGVRPPRARRLRPPPSPVGPLTRKMVVKTDFRQEVLEGHANAIDSD